MTIAFCVAKPNSLRGKFHKNEFCCLQVAVNAAADSSDVVVISIKQPANLVEKQIDGVKR